MSDKGQRTEQPTQRKLKKAREKGQFPTSREFVGGFQFTIFVALVVSFGTTWLKTFITMYRYFFEEAFRNELGREELPGLLRGSLRGGMSMLPAAGTILVAVSIATHLLVTRLGFAGAKLAPDLTRLNPMSRLSQLPRQNISSVVQAIILLPLFLYTVWVVISPHLQELLSLPLGSVEAGSLKVAALLKDMLWKAALAFLIVGYVDLYRQGRRYSSEMRMSKQEVRDEHKEADGNPQIKQRIRRIQRDAARRNMMKHLPTATAVVVNPTHYAVALRYDLEAMAAPSVVAKGKNYLAARIREKATEYKIPIVENPPLAQALYKSVDVGQEIPPHLYRAVAEILAYIFRLTHGKARGQR